MVENGGGSDYYAYGENGEATTPFSEEKIIGDQLLSITTTPSPDFLTPMATTIEPDPALITSTLIDNYSTPELMSSGPSDELAGAFNGSYNSSNDSNGTGLFETTILPLFVSTLETTTESYEPDIMTTRTLITRSTYYNAPKGPHFFTTPSASLVEMLSQQHLRATGDTVYPFSRAPFLVADAFTTLLGLAGNILILVAISRTKLSTPMVGYHRFILSLIVACTLTTGTIAFSFVHEITLLFVPYPALTRKCGETFLKGLMNVGFASALLSVAGLTLDSFIGLFFDAEQYNATTKRRTREINIGIWFFAIGFGLTDLPLSIVHFLSTGGHRPVKSRETDFLDWCSVYIVNKYRLEYALMGVSFPCFIFVFATIARLVMEVRRSDVCWSPNNPDRRWVFRRFVTTTFMLMGIFSVFWLPHTILDVSIVLVSATWNGYTTPNEATLDFTRYLLRSWLLLGLVSIPIFYAIRFRRRVRRQLVDFFSAVCGNGDVNIPEIADDDEVEAPTIRHLLACSSIVGYSFDDSRGSFKKSKRKDALQRVKSCRV